MYCSNCGKEIDDKAVVCVHCGVPTGNFIAPKTVNVPQNVSTGSVNGLGIAGFVVSILSLWLGAYFMVAPIVGLVLSIVGVINRKKYTSCNGLAIAGLVISIVAILLWVFLWVLLIVLAATSEPVYY